MAIITLKGKACHTAGALPNVGDPAPDFILTRTDLTEVRLQDYLGKKIVFNIFPSVDTSTCAKAMHQFNEIANSLTNTVVLCVSADLPFAQQRFCGAEGLKNVIPVSAFRYPEFGKRYGVAIIDGPLAGLLARAVVIIDEKAKVAYTQQVQEISEEPVYNDVVRVLK